MGAVPSAPGAPFDSYLTLRGVRTEPAPNVPALVLRDVEQVRVTDSPPLRDRTVTRAARDSIAAPAASALETR